MLPNTLSYRELVSRWKALREQMRVREVACVGAPRTLLCVEIGASDAAAVHLAAGVHGDEPAGVLALLEMAERDAFDPRFAYRIWPCTNPTGFDAGTRGSADGLDINRTFGRGGGSPEAKAIVMANRDRKFLLAADLHEDDEADAFYAYEYGEPGIGAHIAGERLLRPDPGAEAELLGGLSLSLLLCRNAAHRTLTIETPSSLPIEERVRLHAEALAAAFSLL